MEQAPDPTDPLSEADRARIRAEEEYRAQLRREIKEPFSPPPPKAAPPIRQPQWRKLALLGALLLVLISMFRVYYGGKIGLQVVRKESPSFTDTIVNLDDFLGMPRFAVAAQHPSVKRQMEAFGWVETDEAAHEEIKRKVEREMNEGMEKGRRQLGR